MKLFLIHLLNHSPALRISISIFILMLFFFSCAEKVDVNKTLIVKVKSKPLYLEDFVEMIPAKSSPEDSADIVNHHVDKWIKETLFRLEAEKKVNKVQINKLVESYKNSLLVHNYEVELINENLDTLISDAEMQNFYLQHKAEFILAEPAYLFNVALVPKSEFSSFRKIWKEDKWEELEEICDREYYWHFIADSLWITPKQIKTFVPEIVYSEVKFRKGYYNSISRDSMKYIFEVVDKVKEGQTAPMRVVSKQLKKLILHKRTIQLLENEKSKLYEEAISSSSVVKYSEN